MKSVNMNNEATMLEKARLAKEGCISWEAAAKGTGMSAKSFRDKYRELFKMIDMGVVAFTTSDTPTINDIPDEPIVTAKDGKNGTKCFDIRFPYESNELLKNEDMLRLCHLDPEEWVVASATPGCWNAQKKGGDVIELFSLKITARPKTLQDMGIEDINALFEKISKDCAFPPVPTLQNVCTTGKILEIVLTDTHIGLLSWKDELGKSYDCKIAYHTCIKLIKEIVERNLHNKYSQIVLVTLGDILHVDNADNATTHGTRQDCDGRIPEIYDTATRTLVECVELLKQFNAPIKYVYVPGNHDQVLGYTVAKLVEARYINDPNITFDVTPALYKFLSFGATTVMLTHGEAANKKLADAVTSRLYECADISNTKCVEVHAGHLHDMTISTESGYKILRFPAVCPSSYWEASKGYPAIARGIQVNTYDPKEGGFISIDIVHADYSRKR